MKRYSIHSLLTACLMTLVTGLALVSCSQDEAPDTPALVPEGSPVTVSLTLSTRAQESSETSGHIEAEGHELINDWWVAICEVSGGKPGKIVEIARHSEMKDPKPAPFDQDVVSVELSAPAEYYFFAFANLTESEVKAASGLVFEKGKAPSLSGVSQSSQNSQFSNLSETDFKSLTWDGISTRLSALNAQTTSSSETAQVPMSGMKRVTVTRHVNQKYSIEVVRMLAKIRFEFSNDTGDEITVNSITMKPYLSEGPLNLFPQYDSSWNFQTGKNNTVILSECLGKYATHTFPASKVRVPKNTENATKDTSLQYYLREMKSEGNEPSGLFQLEFNITREGRGTESLYTFTSQSFDYVNRNDYIILPIRFTDWLVEFKFKHYPPIGGYPAITKENDAEFIIRLGTPGCFEMYPTVKRYDKTTGKYIEVIDFEYDIDTDDINQILEKGLEKHDVPEKMIRGDVKTGSKGKASARFTLTEVTTADGATHTTRLPMKKIYIIRE